MLDPVTNALIAGAAGAGAGPLAKQLQDFITAISGHKGESIGTMLGSMMRSRIENAEAVGNRAHLILLNIGLKANEVPMPVLLPLLDGASLHSETSMQEVWANMLANAADPRNLNEVVPSFPAILKDLNLRDVRLLNAIHERLGKKNAPIFPFTQSRLAQLYSDLSISIEIPDGASAEEQVQARSHEFQKYALSFDVLRKHRLVDIVAQPQPIRYDPTRAPNPSAPRAIELRPTNTDVIYLTALGGAFVTACKAPPGDTLVRSPA